MSAVGQGAPRRGYFPLAPSSTTTSVRTTCRSGWYPEARVGRGSPAYQRTAVHKGRRGVCGRLRPVTEPGRGRGRRGRGRGRGWGMLIDPGRGPSVGDCGRGGGTDLDEVLVPCWLVLALPVLGRIRSQTSTVSHQPLCLFVPSLFCPSKAESTSRVSTSLFTGVLLDAHESAPFLRRGGTRTTISDSASRRTRTLAGGMGPRYASALRLAISVFGVAGETKTVPGSLFTLLWFLLLPWNAGPAVSAGERVDIRSHRHCARRGSGLAGSLSGSDLV